MLEQKIEWYDVMSSIQNQLVKLQDENTTLKTKNEYLTVILNADVSGTRDETYDVTFSVQNQLVKLQDENTTETVCNTKQ